MSIFDHPSDPYGGEKRCRICDELLTYNPLIRGYECTHDHDFTPHNQQVPAGLILYRAVWYREDGKLTKGILTDKANAKAQVLFLSTMRNAWLEDSDGNKIDLGV